MGPSSSIFDQHFNPVEESVMCKDMEGTDTYPLGRDPQAICFIHFIRGSANEHHRHQNIS